MQESKLILSLLANKFTVKKSKYLSLDIVKLSQVKFQFKLDLETYQVGIGLQIRNWLLLWGIYVIKNSNILIAIIF